ncbi:MAG: ATP-binding cassette domain-containing protein [Gammaproteobacteria bacterium]|nr:ATP-binding cassette domain-containing protein [Gammaproteobacteria bacterium]
MSILRLRNIGVSFGGPAVLQNINLSIDAGERVCLLGRNGTGKSTLMKVIAGEILPDSGEIERQQGLITAKLDQLVDIGEAGSVFDVVASGLGESAKLLQAYHAAVQQMAIAHSDSAAAELEKAQQAVDAAGAWQLSQQVETILSRMQLDGDVDVAVMSGGMKRRVLLSRALVQQPGLLLLDEPTNHLDMSAITWLEQQLLTYHGAIVFVTHDRAFLRRLATRIVDLDRGVLKSYPGDYQTFLSRKQELLKAEMDANARFDKKLAQEEVWIRQGIKARRTRNEGRVRALHKMRNQRLQRRERAGKALINLAQAERSGKLVVEAESVSFDYQDETLIRDFSTLILRGERIGIIGPNGVGKTTLLHILLGELKPHQGKVKLGTNLAVAYFDQMKVQLDEQATVIDTVSHGRERIDFNGQSKHIIGYLQDFLFAPERVRSPVKSLSGGERSRLLLARLFSQPANVLVLDEPTNDLDIETLELLEELLLEFKGTVLLVSHDREFLNNVVTSTLVFEGAGKLAEFVGGYDDWIRQRTIDPFAVTVDSQPETNKSRTDKRRKPTKLSYKDQRELEGLPEKIESLESEIQRLTDEMSRPEFFQQDKDAIVQCQQQFDRANSDLEACFRRWEQLESIEF